MCVIIYHILVLIIYIDFTNLNAQETSSIQLGSLSSSIFYIDATNGSDTNDGLSEAKAWKTLSKTGSTSFAAGDKILLKRGEEWTDETLFLSNMTGEFNNPVEIDAYGTGENPKVFKSHINRSSYLSMCNISVTKRLPRDQGGDYPMMIQHSDNIIVEECSISGIYTDYSKNITLRKLYVDNNTYEHGLYLCHESKSFLIEDCVFSNNFGSGIQTNGTDMDSIIIRRCLIYGNDISGFNDVNSKNVMLYCNVFIDGNGKAIEIMKNGSNNKYYHNVFVSLTAGKPAIGMSGGESLVMKNNVFYVRTDAFSGAGSSFSSDYNCLFATDSSDPIINWGSNFTTWLGTGNDQHSFIADPKFKYIDLDVDPITWDVTLKDSSSCIEAGIDIGFDYSGKAPDIGIIDIGIPWPKDMINDWHWVNVKKIIKHPWEMVTVYPNPTTNVVNILFSSTIDMTAIEVISNTGLVLFKKEYNQRGEIRDKIDMSAFPAGVYFISLKSTELITTKKIILCK